MDANKADDGSEEVEVVDRSVNDADRVLHRHESIARPLKVNIYLRLPKGPLHLGVLIIFTTSECRISFQHSFFVLSADRVSI